MRLPSFTLFIAFDAAARLGTFTKAGSEQNVSQPAISRRVAMLEMDLGCRLFDRASKPMTLTQSGEKLFDTLRTGLNRLENVVDEIRTDNSMKTVTISAGAGFSTFWLLPRLPELQTANPGVKIRIVSETQEEQRPSSELQIRFGDGNWPHLSSTKILGEEVYPVCSPLYLDGKDVPVTVDDLKLEHLLQLESGWQYWYEWSSWFQAVGASTPRTSATTSFDNYLIMISAVLAGQGVGLCWDGLLDTFLNSGALRRLTEFSATSNRGYYLTFQSDIPKASPVRKIAEQLALSE